MKLLSVKLGGQSGRKNGRRKLNARPMEIKKRNLLIEHRHTLKKPIPIPESAVSNGNQGFMLMVNVAVIVDILHRCCFAILKNLLREEILLGLKYEILLFV